VRFVPALALALVGCDQGPRLIDPVAGPALELVSSYPAHGEGLDCSLAEPACGVPIDARLELRFDRFLLPSTAVRQSIAFFSGAATNVVPEDRSGPEILPSYDPLERVVTFSLPPGATLQPNTLYTVQIPVVRGEDALGFRAFDGTPMAEDEPVHISFRTSNALGTAQPLAAPHALDCSELICTALGQDDADCGLPITSGCAAAHCHGAPDTAPRMGLSLASPHSLADATGRVAHQTETGPTTGRALANPPRFGTAMPVIDPGRPGNSYLVYKLLLAPETYQPSVESDACSRYHAATDPERCIEPAAEELTRLREWFVRGEPMPPANHPRFVDAETARRIIDFIAAGANCR
jgi:hypothetical protein